MVMTEDVKAIFADARTLARTGHNPERTPTTSRELQSLAQREPAVESLVGRYTNSHEFIL